MNPREHPKVREALDAFHTATVNAIVAGGPLPASAEEPHQAIFRALEAVKANEAALLAAVIEALAEVDGLDFEAAQKAFLVDLDGVTVAPGVKAELERQAQAALRPLVECVREWQEAYTAERKDAHIGSYSLLERRCKAEEALSALALPEE